MIALSGASFMLRMYRLLQSFIFSDSQGAHPWPVALNQNVIKATFFQGICNESQGDKLTFTGYKGLRHDNLLLSELKENDSLGILTFIASKISSGSL